MPFKKIGDDEQKMQFPSAPDKLPIFLIPGILGYGAELDSLAWELYKQSDSQRPIYIYYDERVTTPPDNAKFVDLTLDELVNSIAEEIQGILPNPVGSFPFFMIGYSYGCTLATLTAQYLKAQGEDPYVYLIDGASPQCSKLFSTNQKDLFMDDVIHIMNYAAQLSALKQCTVDNKNIVREALNIMSIDAAVNHVAKAILLENINQLSSSNLEIFKQLNIGYLNKLPDQCAIEHIENAIELDCDYPDSQDLQNFELSLKELKRYMGIVKTNLSHFTTYTHSDANPLKSITALITTNTANKYQNPKCGWENHVEHAKDIHLVNFSKKLLEQNHTDLLKEDVKARLAHSINKFLKQSVSRQQFEDKAYQYLASDLKRYENSSGDDDTFIDSDDDDINKLPGIRSSKPRPIYSPIYSAMSSDENELNLLNSYASSPASENYSSPSSENEEIGRLPILIQQSTRPQAARNMIRRNSIHSLFSPSIDDNSVNPDIEDPIDIGNNSILTRSKQ